MHRSKRSNRGVLGYIAIGLLLLSWCFWFVSPGSIRVEGVLWGLLLICFIFLSRLQFGGQASGWIAFFSFAHVTLNVLLSICAITRHDSLLYILFLHAFCIFLTFTLLHRHRQSNLYPLLRVLYLTPLTIPLYLIYDGWIHFYPDRTWSSFDLHGQTSAISGTRLLFTGLGISVLYASEIALFERYLRAKRERDLREITISSSPHSPAPAPAPPTQSEP